MSAARCETVADQRLPCGASSAARCETVADSSLPSGATSSSTRSDTLVPLVVTASVELRPDHGGHRAEGVEHEYDNDEDSDNESCHLELTDSSSEDDSVTPGERVRRLFNGVTRFRRARRNRTKLVQPTIEPSSEEEPPGINPSSDESDNGGHNSSSDEEWPYVSDPNYVDYADHRLVREGPGGDSMAESFTGSNEPRPLRKILEPSRTESTAIEVMRHVRFADRMCEEDDHHPPIGSVGRLFSGTDDGSCRRTLHTPRERHPLQAETRNQCDRALNGISMLQEVRRSGISAVRKPDEWVLIEVTVDSGACVTVMPSGLCSGIPILDNDFIQERRRVRSRKWGIHSKPW